MLIPTEPDVVRYTNKYGRYCWFNSSIVATYWTMDCLIQNSVQKGKIRKKFPPQNIPSQAFGTDHPLYIARQRRNQNLPNSTFVRLFYRHFMTKGFKILNPYPLMDCLVFECFHDDQQMLKYVQYI